MKLIEIVLLVNGRLIESVRVPAPIDDHDEDMVPKLGDEVVVAIREVAGAATGQFIHTKPTKLERA